MLGLLTITFPKPIEWAIVPEQLLTFLDVRTEFDDAVRMHMHIGSVRRMVDETEGRSESVYDSVLCVIARVECQKHIVRPSSLKCPLLTLSFLSLMEYDAVHPSEDSPIYHVRCRKKSVACFFDGTLRDAQCQGISHVQSLPHLALLLPTTLFLGIEQELVASVDRYTIAILHEYLERGTCTYPFLASTTRRDGLEGHTGTCGRGRRGRGRLGRWADVLFFSGSTR
jgi:hypothetical protein